VAVRVLLWKVNHSGTVNWSWVYSIFQ